MEISTLRRTCYTYTISYLLLCYNYNRWCTYFHRSPTQLAELWQGKQSAPYNSIKWPPWIATNQAGWRMLARSWCHACDRSSIVQQTVAILCGTRYRVRVWSMWSWSRLLTFLVTFHFSMWGLQSIRNIRHSICTRYVQPEKRLLSFTLSTPAQYCLVHKLRPILWPIAVFLLACCCSLSMELNRCPIGTFARFIVNG